MDLDAIKAATWGLHTKAERTGIIADIVAGRASRLGVALLLRNLLPVYEALDGSLLGHPVLVRCAVIEADLRLLSPYAELPLLAEGAAYAEQVRCAAAGDGEALIAHAYVRYLGDLNGGQILKRQLVRCLGELAHDLRFHDYPGLEDRRAFAQAYRDELDTAVRGARFDDLVREAVTVFEMNIALSEAVRAAAG